MITKEHAWDGEAWHQIASSNLAGLEDVNLTTTLPVDGDRLGYHAASSKWVPLAGASGSSQWIPYTPTWTALTTNPSLGNGTISGIYRYFGNNLDVGIRITFGTSTTYGSGSWRFSLPLTFKAISVNIAIIGAGRFIRGTALALLLTTIDPGAHEIAAAIPSFGTDETTNEMDAISGPGGGTDLPAWAAGDIIDLTWSGPVDP